MVEIMDYVELPQLPEANATHDSAKTRTGKHRMVGWAEEGRAPQVLYESGGKRVRCHVVVIARQML